MKPTRKALDLFLGALAVGAAVGVLFRRSPKGASTAPAPDSGAAEPLSKKQWAGSLARTIRHELREDETVTIAAALSFYAMLAIIPAAFSAVLIYGLVLDPSDLADQIDAIAGALPDSFRTEIAEEIAAIANGSTTSLGVGLVASIISTLWIASSGVRALLHGINLVFNVKERRSWWRQRALAYGLTLGLILFALSTTAVVTFLPGWLEDLGLGSAGVQLIEIGRWPAIFTIVVIGLAVLYRVGPNLKRRRDHMIFPGAVAAAALWLVATFGFSIYTGSGVSSFDAATYSTLTSIVVILVWFFVSGFVVLLGAEINASFEAHRGDGH